MKKSLLLLFITSLFASNCFAQTNNISIDPSKSLGYIFPYIYGQFIEYMGTCIDGGVFEEDSPLSDEQGFRLDVLEKVKELNPTMLRFPGGTVVKTFHWEDGVGPKESRKSKKNLIWGGINHYHFGTCEFIEYSREVGAEPVLVINLSTGTPDEAANWAQMVNVLAPIMTNEKTSIRQTVFYPLQVYRQYHLKESIHTSVNTHSIDDDLKVIDASATIDRDNNIITLFVVNISQEIQETSLSFIDTLVDSSVEVVTYKSSSLDAKNKLAMPDVDVVLTTNDVINIKEHHLLLPAESFTVCRFIIL